MKCFAVIRVDQDYDYVEGAECIGSFPTEQEANDLINKMKSDTVTSWTNRVRYIDAFVESLSIPDTDYHGWLEFLKKFHPFGERYVFPKDFKGELKRYLASRHAKLEGYDPPKAISGTTNLFAVEIDFHE